MTVPSQILVLQGEDDQAALIAKRVREFGVSATVWPCDGGITPLPAGVCGIIVTGATTDARRDAVIDAVLKGPVPVLAVGAGFDLMNVALGGQQRHMGRLASGMTTVRTDDRSGLLDQVPAPLSVWMRRTSVVAGLAAALTAIAWDVDGHVVGAESQARQRFGVRFHPHLAASDSGRLILRRFVHDICGCRSDWRLPEQIPGLLADVREAVGSRPVIALLSGGLYSAVTVGLLQRALPEPQVVALHVDTGVMRQGESERVLALAQAMNLRRIEVRDAHRDVLAALGGLHRTVEKHACLAQQLQARAIHAAARAEGTDRPTLAFGQVSPAGDMAPVAAGHTCNRHLSAGDGGDAVITPLHGYFRDEVRQLG
ncbi:MAG: gamma-glutamyl-gamma-aminobutyrate hydrolase family protein, partial [Candidatus Sericytochromatia bacterium]|nr:gamma-glutamyl-gamma-aminobutyrate hydrolase family protein [Candidatus Sericytochromatia bacterium]